MGQYIEQLATFTASIRWTEIPTAIQARAKLALLDTIGVILAGSLRPEVQGLRAALTQSAGVGATVLAPSLPATDPQTAALLNAVAGRSIELCDGLRGLQPSVQLIPGLLALAEQKGATGQALMTAFVAGYEVAGRLAWGFTPRPFAHPNGQLGLLACAAAGARLLGQDGGALSLAMRIATTMLMTPSYNNTVAGATALNLPAGLSAVAAILAPTLGATGTTAQPDAVEEALNTMAGSGFDPTTMTNGLGTDWQIAGSYFRFYACCNPIHPALDCLQDVVAALGATADAIERIDVRTYAFASIMRNAQPSNYFASKYSLPHAAATLLVRGGLGFAQLDDSALTDPTIAALRLRVHVAEDPAFSVRVPAERPARVTVTLKDRRQATAERAMSRRDQDQSETEPEVRAKFRQLAATVLSPSGIAAVEQATDNTEAWPSVTTLTTLLRQHLKTPWAL